MLLGSLCATRVESWGGGQGGPWTGPNMLVRTRAIVEVDFVYFRSAFSLKFSFVSCVSKESW